jgi:hypothetical protein
VDTGGRKKTSEEGIVRSVTVDVFKIKEALREFVLTSH